MGTLCKCKEAQSGNYIWTQKSTQKMPPFYLDGRCLEIVWCYKYVGVELHQSLNWTSNSKNLCTWSWKAVYKLESMGAGWDIPPRKCYLYMTKLLSPLCVKSTEIRAAMKNCVSYDNRDETVLREKNECIPVEEMHVKLCKGDVGVNTKDTNVQLWVKWVDTARLESWLAVLDY